MPFGGPRVSADLSAAGEVDTFHFDVAAADDHGRGLNARIVRRLNPGSYWLSVRHKNPTGTGQYTIGVKKAGA